MTEKKKKSNSWCSDYWKMQLWVKKLNLYIFFMVSLGKTPSQVFIITPLGWTHPPPGSILFLQQKGGGGNYVDLLQIYLLVSFLLFPGRKDCIFVIWGKLVRVLLLVIWELAIKTSGLSITVIWYRQDILATGIIEVLAHLHDNCLDRETWEMAEKAIDMLHKGTRSLKKKRVGKQSESLESQSGGSESTIAKVWCYRKKYITWSYSYVLTIFALYLFFMKDFVV